MPPKRPPSLDAVFRRARRARRAALVGYLPAGYPTYARSIAAGRVLAAHCDVLEIGFPQAAVWDGPEIRRACTVARRACPGPAEVTRLIRELTASVSVPVVAMSYWATITDGGVGAVAARLADAGAVGLVLPDVHPDGPAAGQWLAAADRTGLRTSFLAADGQAGAAAAASTAWAYQPAVAGPTGARALLDLPSIRSRTHTLRRFGSAPVCVGIGVSSPYQAAAVAPGVDGVVIGTRFVRALTDGGLRGLSLAAREYAAAVSAVRGDHPGRAAA